MKCSRTPRQKLGSRASLLHTPGLHLPRNDVFIRAPNSGKPWSPGSTVFLTLVNEVIPRQGMTLPSTLGNLNIVFGATENLAVVSVAILLK